MVSAGGGGQVGVQSGQFRKFSFSSLKVLFFLVIENSGNYNFKGFKIENDGRTELFAGGRGGVTGGCDVNAPKGVVDCKGKLGGFLGISLATTQTTCIVRGILCLETTAGSKREREEKLTNLF